MNWAQVPARPPSPFTGLLQTTPIGIGIGYRGGWWVRQRVKGGGGELVNLPYAKTSFSTAMLL